MGVQQSTERFGLAVSLGCRRRANARTSLTSYKSCAKLESLGDELLHNVSSGLRACELGRLSTACRPLFQVISDEVVWHQALYAAGGAPSALPRSALQSIVNLSSTHWKQLAAQGRCPPARGHHVAFACRGGTLILYGGRQHWRGIRGDCWALDVASGCWVEAATKSRSKPGSRTFTADGGGGGVLQDLAGEQWMVIYGGLRQEGYRDNETWALGPLRGGAQGSVNWCWREIQSGGGAQSPDRPMPRFHHSQTVLAGSILAVVGGHNFMVRAILGTGLLNFHTNEPEWQITNDGQGSPPARAYHSATEWHGKLVIFGGETHMQQLRDTWILQPTDGTWRQIPVDFPDAAGRAHAASAVVEERFLVVCGGSRQARSHVASEVNRNLCSDMWMLNLEDPTACGWTSVDVFCNQCVTPQATTLHSGRTLIVFGGHDGSVTDHFDDPCGGFADFDKTLAIRFGSKFAFGQVPTQRLCDKGWVGRTVDASWALVPFHELGLAVACRAGQERVMMATVLKFDPLQEQEANHLPINVEIATPPQDDEDHREETDEEEVDAEEEQEEDTEMEGGEEEEDEDEEDVPIDALATLASLQSEEQRLLA